MDELVEPRPSVLLVDDSDDERDLYELLLASEFDIVHACRGAEALALASAKRPSVVVLDIAMPGIDGFETCRRLKADPSTAKIPVVMLTASDFVPAEALVAGAFAVLTKPCPDRMLVETIVRALSGVVR